MHSSRMRTAYLLPVFPSIHCSQGVCLLRGVSTPGGCLPRGVFAPMGVSAWGGVCPDTPRDRILDTRFWKYYLAPTSLRAVKMNESFRSNCTQNEWIFTKLIQLPEQLSSWTSFRGFGHSGTLSRLCPPQNIIVFIQVLYANRHFCLSAAPKTSEIRSPTELFRIHNSIWL